MMNSKKLVESLVKSNFVKSEIPMQMEMGLPFIKKTAHGVVICFKPHKEIVRDGVTDIYSHQFEVEWVYPFNHISYFKNLSVYSESIASVPICTIKDQMMLDEGVYYINKLYEELDNILDYLQYNKTVPDIAISNYQKMYRKVVEKLGLEQLYFDKD